MLWGLGINFQLNMAAQLAVQLAVSLAVSLAVNFQLSTFNFQLNMAVQMAVSLAVSLSTFYGCSLMPFALCLAPTFGCFIQQFGNSAIGCSLITLNPKGNPLLITLTTLHNMINKSHSSYSVFNARKIKH